MRTLLSAVACDLSEVLDIKKNSMAEKNRRIYRQSSLPLELPISKIFLSSKQKHIWAILADFSPGYHEVKKTRQIPTKNNIFFAIRGQFIYGVHLQTFPYHCNTRKHQPQILTHRCKKTQSKKTSRLYSTIQGSKKEALTNFLHLCLNNLWVPGPKPACISKKSNLF